MHMQGVPENSPDLLMLQTASIRAFKFASIAAFPNLVIKTAAFTGATILAVMPATTGIVLYRQVRVMPDLLDAILAIPKPLGMIVTLGICCLELKAIYEYLTTENSYIANTFDALWNFFTNEMLYLHKYDEHTTHIDTVC